MHRVPWQRAAAPAAPLSTGDGSARTLAETKQELRVPIINARPHRVTVSRVGSGALEMLSTVQ